MGIALTCPRRLLAAAMAVTLSGMTSAADLRIGFKAEVTSADPHVLGAANRGVWMNVYDSLIGQDEKLHPIPLLALSWKAIDEKQWEFKLRPGVKFHNGEPMTANDVKFSLDRARALAGPKTFKTYLRAVDSVRVQDPLTVIIKTKEAAPTLPENVGLVAILSKGSGAEIKEEDFENGKAAVGTGPFKYAGLIPSQQVTMTRNDAYWGSKPAWSKVIYQLIPKEPARAAAMLGGSVDVIDGAAGSLTETLKKSGKVSVVSTTSYLLNYLAMDQFRAVSPYVTSHDGKPLAKNPFQDKRVRQAITVAINRDAINKFVMKGDAEPATQIVPAGFFGYEPALKLQPGDTARAKALLTEAGYPSGFKVVLHCTNDRYLNDARVCEAIAQMLTQAGIKTDTRTLPYANFITRATSGGAGGEPEFSLAMCGIGAVLGDSLEPYTAVVHTFDKALGTGANNYGRYSNKEFDAAIRSASKTLSEKEREELLRTAARVAAEDVAIVPVHNAKVAWGLRKGLSMSPRSDGFTIANGIKDAASK
ncbi:ABC transporter substrate-binding protein [Polaromonas sp. P5_D5]